MDEKKRKALSDMLRKQASEHTRTPALALQWMIDHGLIDQAGELRPQFGGNGPREDDR
jgi:hypothetical protein